MKDTTQAESLEGRRLMAALESRLFGASTEPVRLGRFEITERIGSGGMGSVYRANDPELGRPIALKLVNTSVESSRDDGLRERMLREGRALAQLSHPNVVTVFEAGVAGDDVYLAIELVEGGDLRQWVREHPPGGRARTRRALDLIVQAGRGLVAAHRVGMVHRDFKPANVLVGTDGRVRVADFGLVRPLSSLSGSTDDVFIQGDVATADGSSSGQLEPLTKTGALVGTPAYMAPEQLHGGPADERSDQFAFCVTAFEALFGVRPFYGKTIEGVLEAIDARRIRSPRVAGVPGWVRRLLRHGLDPDPARRHPSVQHLVTAIERRLRVWPRTIAIAGAVSVAFAGGLSLQGVTGQDICEIPPPDDPIWSKERRRAVRAVFERSGYSFADASFQRVEDSILAWMDAWRAEQVDVCEATRVRAEQSDEALDLRMACLERLRSRVGGSLDVIANGAEHPEVLLRADELMSTLPSFEACGDLAALRRSARPRTPDQSKKLTELARGVDFAQSLHRLRYIERAQEQVGPLIAPLQALGSSEALAEALELQLRSCHGGAEACRPAVEAALDAAQDIGRPDLEARVWGLNASEIGRAKESLDAARVAFAAAFRAAERHNAPRELRADLLVQQAFFEHVFANDPEAAIAPTEEAIAIIEEDEGSQSARLIGPLGQIAQPLRALNRHEEALAAIERAYALALEHFGSQNPMASDKRREIALALSDLRRTEDAVVWIERALAEDLEFLGPDDVATAESYSLSAQLMQDQAKWEDSLPRFDAALRAYEGKAPKLIPGLLGMRAQSYGEVGRDDDALSDLDRSVDTALELFGSTHFVTGRAYRDRGDFRARRQEWEAASHDHRLALEAAEAAFGQQSPRVAARLRALAIDQSKLGDRRTAVALLERALELVPSTTPYPATHVAAALALADVLIGSKPARARTLVTGAKTVASAADESRRAELIERCDQWLSAHP